MLYKREQCNGAPSGHHEDGRLLCPRAQVVGEGDDNLESSSSHQLRPSCREAPAEELQWRTSHANQLVEIQAKSYKHILNTMIGTMSALIKVDGSR